MRVDGSRTVTKRNRKFLRKYVAPILSPPPTSASHPSLPPRPAPVKTPLCLQSASTQSTVLWHCQPSPDRDMPGLYSLPSHWSPSRSQVTSGKVHSHHHIGLPPTPSAHGILTHRRRMQSCRCCHTPGLQTTSPMSAWQGWGTSMGLSQFSESRNHSWDNSRHRP